MLCSLSMYVCSSIDKYLYRIYYIIKINTAEYHTNKTLYETIKNNNCCYFVKHFVDDSIFNFEFKQHINFLTPKNNSATA